MKTLADRIIDFNLNLHFEDQLPEGFKTINPFSNNPETVAIMKQFYQEYYGDNIRRKLVLGINPGRLGSGTTGIPFTDTKRLEEYLHIKMKSASTHEVSAMFVYAMITAYGGVEKFYKNVYINSPFPLAIVRESKKDNWLNANYYDDKILYESVRNYMIKTIETHLEWNLFDTNEVYVLGKKNDTFISKLNDEGHFFKKLIVLEHPRYIQQYKTKEIPFYIEKYISALG